MIDWKTAGVYKTENKEHYVLIPITLKIYPLEYKMLCKLIEQDNKELIDEIIKEILKKEIEEFK